MPTAQTALVIGGGIAGPVAATALAMAGIDAAMYEARPADPQSAGQLARVLLALTRLHLCRLIRATSIQTNFPGPSPIPRHSRRCRLLSFSTMVPISRRWRFLHWETSGRCPWRSI